MPKPPEPPPDVVAAGIVARRAGGEVLLVHRPKYDDWSFPKGKLEAAEPAPVAAVREAREETGLDLRLGPPLADQHYPVQAGRKVVHYWAGRVVGDDDVSGYAPNDEIDQVTWVRADKAVRLLSYDHDRATLAEALVLPRRTRTLVVLRHARAHARSRWHSDDRFRPLAVEGARQAEELCLLLAAYDVRRLVSSSSTRCVSTLVPYAEATGRIVETEDLLSEEDATVEAVLEVLGALMEATEPAVVCTHRPVLPTLFDALGVPDPGLEPAGLVVVHHRRGVVIATERQRTP